MTDPTPFMLIRMDVILIARFVLVLLILWQVVGIMRSRHIERGLAAVVLFTLGVRALFLAWVLYRRHVLGLLAPSVEVSFWSGMNQLLSIGVLFGILTAYRARWSRHE